MSSGIALLFSRTFGTRWGWGVSPTPRPPLPPGNARYILYRRLGGPKGRSGKTKNLVITGIRSRTVQPVAQSLYRLSYPAQTFCILHFKFQYIIFIKKRKQGLAILRRCQLYIKTPFKLQPEDGLMKPETRICYVLVINYILCNKVVLDYKIIYLLTFTRQW